MRIYLIIITVLFSLTASADFAELIEAVKADDTVLVAKILSESVLFGVPTIDINSAEVGTQRRPVYYVESEEMLRLLLANDAVLHGDRNQLHRDCDGMNPLHVLFAETAPRLLLEADDMFVAIQRIERLAFTLLLAFRQENGAGRLNREPIEAQRDGANRIPADYLDSPFWRTEFIERMASEHYQYYVEPEGGFEAAALRKKKLARKLQLEHRLQMDLERQRERERLADLAAPVPLRPHNEWRPMLRPEFAPAPSRNLAISFLDMFNSK